MNVGKKNVILAIAICVAITLVGVSFAYFISGVLFTGEGSNVSLTPGDFIKVSYDAGTAIDLQNALPGATAQKDFTITVSPTDTEKKATYSIYLDISNNTFEKCDSTNQTADNMCTIGANEITYVLKDDSDNELASGDLTEATGKIELLKETKEVETQTVYNYTLELSYINTGADQNHNASKTFTSNLKVEFAEE